VLGPDWTNSEPLGGRRSCKSPSACSWAASSPCLSCSIPTSSSSDQRAGLARADRGDAIDQRRGARQWGVAASHPHRRALQDRSAMAGTDFGALRRDAPGAAEFARFVGSCGRSLERRKLGKLLKSPETHVIEIHDCSQSFHFLLLD
jgi:hypothetical protein